MLRPSARCSRQAQLVPVKAAGPSPPPPAAPTPAAASAHPPSPGAGQRPRGGDGVGDGIVPPARTYLWRPPGLAAGCSPHATTGSPPRPCGRAARTAGNVPPPPRPTLLRHQAGRALSAAAPTKGTGLGARRGRAGLTQRPGRHLFARARARPDRGGGCPGCRAGTRRGAGGRGSRAHREQRAVPPGRKKRQGVHRCNTFVFI